MELNDDIIQGIRQRQEHTRLRILGGRRCLVDELDGSAAGIQEAREQQIISASGPRLSQRC